MNMIYVTVFLFAYFCNIFASKSERLNYSQVALDILDSRDFAQWTKYFDEGNGRVLILRSFERAALTDDFEAMHFLLDRFDQRRNFRLAEEAAFFALENTRTDALQLAVQKMNPSPKMTDLMMMAFTLSNCLAIKMINRRITDHETSFHPRGNLKKLSWEAAQADNLDVFRELLASDFFWTPYTIATSPFEYEEITEDEFLSLLSYIPARHWIDYRMHVVVVYSKALNRKFLRALRFILYRFSLQQHHRNNPNGYDGDLRDLIRYNSISVLNFLLESQVDVNHDLYSHSPEYLHRLLDFAVMWSKPEIVRLLFERGAEINHLDHNGSNSAIVQAILSGRTDIYQMLVDAGADPTLTPESKQELLKKIDMNRPSNQRSLFLCANGK